MRVVLDACVLYPTLLRELLLAAAEADLVTPFWSERILEEWRRAAVRRDGDSAAVAAEIARSRARFPQATRHADPGIEARLSLPDPGDCHVLATAISARAQVLVTLNLRDFPGRSLAREAVVPRHPDSLLLELWQEAPAAIAAAASGILIPAAAATGLSPRALLKKARLPRLGKALVQTGPGDRLDRT